jgi:hypothetical protein
MKKLIDKHLLIEKSEKSEIKRLKKNVDLTTEVAIKFGRYLLKEATHKWNKEALLCWQVKNKEYDTHFLFEKFVNEELN